MAVAAKFLSQRNIDFTRLSGQYLGYGILLGLLRAFWLVGDTSGLFGTPADAWIGTMSDVLAGLMVAYLIVGVIVFGLEIVRRLQTQQNEPLFPLIINVLGVGLMLVFTMRVAYVAEHTPQPFVTWAQLFVTGLIRGGVYALVALGYTMVYGILLMINFAHGEVMMFGAYSGYFAMQYLTRSGTQTFETGSAELATFLFPVIVALLFVPFQRLRQLPESNRAVLYLTMLARFALGFAIGYGALVGLGSSAPHMYLFVITVLGVAFVMTVGAGASMGVSMMLERLAYRPLRRAPRLILLISAIGASFFLQEAAFRIFGSLPKTYPEPLLLNDPKTFSIGLGGTLGTMAVSKVGVMIVVASIGLMFLLYTIVQRTKIGKAMRAVAQDKDTAALMGINVDLVILFTFMLGAALAGIGGVMLGLWNFNINSRFGFTPGLKAFTAAVVGGIGNIPGAMVGGFFLGVIEYLGPPLLGIGNEWQNAITFSLLVVVLIFRPTGLLGELVQGKKV